MTTSWGQLTPLEVEGPQSVPPECVQAQRNLGSAMIALPFLGTVSSVMSGHYGTILIFILVGFVFAGLALGVAKLIRPSNPSPAKMTTYECGELPSGSSWVRFNVRFYLIALFFIIFDVEVIFLYPWAVVFKTLFPVPGLGALVFWEMIIFLAILTIGLAYVWVKGDLDWVKTLTARPDYRPSDTVKIASVPSLPNVPSAPTALDDEVPTT